MELITKCRQSRLSVASENTKSRADYQCCLIGKCRRYCEKTQFESRTDNWFSCCVLHHFEWVFQDISLALDFHHLL